MKAEPLEKKTLLKILENIIKTNAEDQWIRIVAGMLCGVTVREKAEYGETIDLLRKALEEAQQRFAGEKNHSVLPPHEFEIHLGMRHSSFIAEIILQRLTEHGYNIYQKGETVLIKPEEKAEALQEIVTLLENLSKSSNEILIVDKHFDMDGTRFLKYLRNRVKLLIGKEKVDKVLKETLTSIRSVETRVLREEDASLIHDRFLLTDKIGFVVPPVNLWGKKLSLFVQIAPEYLSIVRDYIERLWNKTPKIENLP